MRPHTDHCAKARDGRVDINAEEIQTPVDAMPFHLKPTIC